MGGLLQGSSLHLYAFQLLNLGVVLSHQLTEHQNAAFPKNAVLPLEPKQMLRGSRHQAILLWKYVLGKNWFYFSIHRQLIFEIHSQGD